MNKSFKSVWCEKSGTFVATSEMSKSRGKKASSRVAAAAFVAAGGLATLVGTQAASAAGVNAVEVGAAAEASGDASVAVGDKARAAGTGTVALGD